MQETDPKNTLYSRNYKILRSVKNGLFAKAIVRQDGQFGSGIKMAKNISKTTLQPHYSCLMQKTAWENTLVSRNDKILRGVKNGHFA